MNAMFATTAALPTILNQPSIRIGRRRQIDDFCPDASDLDRFNRLLAKLGRRMAPLNRDQLATAARELCDRSTRGTAPPCIGLRMRRVASLSRMIADPGWHPANETIDVAGLVIDYVRGDNDLIPDRLRKVGRLDDAIVIETAWPRLEAEVEGYLDFQRVRLLEAELRGSTEFEFTRADWEQARAAEAALIAHQRSVREHSYVPSAAGMFHVH